MGQLPGEGPNSDEAHSRLEGVKGLGALETGKQACHSHSCPQSVPHQQDTLHFTP